MNRRHFLLSGTMLGTGLILAGCQPGQSNPLASSAFVADLTDLGTIIASVEPEMQAAGMGSSALTTLNTIVKNVEAAAQSVNSASSQTQGQSVLTQIEGDINAIAPIVAPFVSLVPGGAAISLIIAALPAIEAAINLGVSVLSPQAQALTNAAPPAVKAARATPAAPLATADQALALMHQRALELRIQH